VILTEAGTLLLTLESPLASQPELYESVNEYVLDDGGDPPPQHQQEQQQQGEVGEMFGSLSSTNLSTSRGVGDDWAKDGLSLSVESASDVDMT